MNQENTRTTNNIINDLLKFAIDYEWSRIVNVECNCHPVYVHCCPNCEAAKGSNHKSWCGLNKLIDETFVILEGENEFSRINGENIMDLPRRNQ